MDYLKKIGYGFAYTLAAFLIFTLILTLLSYVDVFSGKVVSFIQLFIPIGSLLMGGYVIGKRSKSNGWLEGLKFSLLFLTFLILFDYLGLGVAPQLKNVVFYLIIVVSSILGSMIGINRRKNNS